MKHEKREDNRKINSRSWHVRPTGEKLSGMKCSTIKISDPSVSFSDMYHYFTCPELGIGFAALRRFPCNWDVDETRFDILHHSAVASSINIGAVGAVCTSDENVLYGYYLFEFASLPYTDQDHDDDKEDDYVDGCISLKCDGS